MWPLCVCMYIDIWLAGVICGYLPIPDWSNKSRALTGSRSFVNNNNNVLFL